MFSINGEEVNISKAELKQLKALLNEAQLYQLNQLLAKQQNLSPEQKEFLGQLDITSNPHRNNQQQIPSKPESFFQPFAQNDIIQSLPDHNMKTLMNFDKRFGGLCELCCNFVFLNDLLGPNKTLNITPENINQQYIKNSHILDRTSLIVKVIAFLFDIYPFSIMSYTEQRELLSKNSNTLEINRKILNNKFDTLEVGTYLKFEVFTKSGLKFSGHSMLIKKTGKSQYSFFDPNKGEKGNLLIDQLEKHINQAVLDYDGTNVAFLDAQAFSKKIGISAEEETASKPQP